MKPVKNIRNYFAFVFAMTLAACSSGEYEDLQKYIDEVKSRPGTPLAGLPEAKPYDRFLYEDADLRDPFKPTTKIA
ncbi:MAG: pilus assembly protein PilP, partial [Gammaproteobacteria bacterium]|nr:pilus assembly protein PilP [Gammaproteobacteria bacterium]